MATKKSKFVHFGILVISAWVLGSAIQAGAETLNFKVYSYVTKSESVPIGDVEGHAVSLTTRAYIYVFENGEVATGSNVSTGDRIKGAGLTSIYATINFADGSTIIIKGQSMSGRTATGALASTESKSEIIKGTGRFEGIKGTLTGGSKYFPVEKGEIGPKGYGEGTITYTLPPR